MSPVASYLVQTVVTLAGVSALAVILLYGARRVGISRASGPLEILGRLPLDARRTIYLVRAGTKTYVIAASEAGLVKLGELESSGEAPGESSHHAV